MRRLYRPAILIVALIGISACGGGGGTSTLPGGGSATAPSGLGRAALSLGGPTCNVPADYPTIQAAVNASGCATINVAPGSYTENVSILRTLTLRGAQAGHDARAPRGSESAINGGLGPDVTISANSVTVDGFTLNGPVSSGTAAIVMQTGNSGETIKNNIVNNPGRAASFTTSNTVFFQNLVKSTATASDGFQGNSTPVQNVLLADNTFGGANGGELQRRHHDHRRELQHRRNGQQEQRRRYAHRAVQDEPRARRRQHGDVDAPTRRRSSSAAATATFSSTATL